MASTGAKLPTSGTSVSASPWSDNSWTSPGNVTAIDTTYASVTASTFDSGDQTYRLRCTGFDFSAIPDGSTINGITVKINNARYANGTGSLDLCQLVSSGTPIGDNKYATPQALTTTATTDYTVGGTSDVWGATLTAAIVKSATFGIDLGCLSTAENTDVFIDAVEMTVEYTAPVTTITLTPSSDSVAPGEYAIFTATVSLDGTPTSGQTVTASSSSTGTAVVLVADEQASSGDMTWRNNSVPSPTYSAPGGTSPLGATIRRFTEAAATTYHQGGWSAIDHTNMAAGDKIIVVLEVKVTNATAVAIGSYSNTDGTVAYNAALNPSTGATATSANYGTINSSTTADLGSGWWLWIVEYTYAAGSDGSMLPSVALSNTTTATIPSYAGNTSNYMDIGVCTIYVQRASPSTTTTDGSGEQLIFVRGVANGTSNITATANSVTSDASVLTVSSSGTYNEDITDSASATDEATVSAVLVEAVSDSAAGSEAVTDISLEGAAAGAAPLPMLGSLLEVPTIVQALEGSTVTASAGGVAPQRTVALTGSAVTAAAGTLGLEHALAVTGAEVASAVGTLTAAAAYSVALTGAEVTVSAGTVSAGSDTTTALAGSAVSADAGSVATAHANALAGSTAVAATGTLVAGRAKAVAGAEASATTGALTPERAVALTGAESGAVAGTLSVVTENNVTVALTGAQAAAAAGSVASTRTVALTGSYVSAIAGNVVVLGGRGQEAAGRPKHRRVILGDRLYRVLERDIPALLEAELLDRAPPVTAEVIEGPKPPRKRAKKAPQPVKTVEQVRETVQQIKRRIEPDDAWLAQALEAVAFRVLERLQDEEDSLMLLLAA